MKAYYYLLFRIYNYYTEKGKESQKVAIMRTLLVSILFIYMVLFTSLPYIDFYSFRIIDQILPNNSSVIAFMAIIGFLNYWFFIKDKKFLNYNFKTYKKGGYAIIGFMVLLACIFIFIVNKNREKISKQQERARIEKLSNYE